MVKVHLYISTINDSICNEDSKINHNSLIIEKTVQSNYYNETEFEDLTLDDLYIHYRIFILIMIHQ